MFYLQRLAVLLLILFDYSCFKELKMENLMLKTSEDVLRSLHPILKKELSSLNKLDEAINEIIHLNNDRLKWCKNFYFVIDEYSFLWPTIISFGSEKLGVVVSIYQK